MKSQMIQDDYKASIPACCSLQTMEEHVGIMLCWGLVASLRDNYPMNCTGCDLAVHPDRTGVP